MTPAFWIQFAGSAVAVALLVGLAAWARIPKALPVLTLMQARALLAQVFPAKPIDALWIADDGRGAVARSGEIALVIYAAGDGFVARHLAWTDAVKAQPAAGRVNIDLHDFAAPRVRLRFETWPPVV